MQNRRMYRGKGFKDGNLPKPKKNYAKKPATNKYGDADAATEGVGQNDTELITESLHEQSLASQLSPNLVCQSDFDEKVKSQINLPTENKNIGTSNKASASEGDQAVIMEIKHLRKRMLNIQESIQLSPSYAQPPIWSEKCLNAVRNCVNEWRNIVSYHGEKQTQTSCNLIPLGENKSHSDDDIEECAYKEEYPMHPRNEWSKSTALQVYGLVQMAMQSGPLKGSNPGYFKRCGAEVASIAKIFLINCASDKEGLELGDVEKDLRFTAKQKESIEKWIRNAEKAIAANKPPSKSALKLQATSKGDKKKHKKSKG